jgi:transcriptional regulator with XRE-family HTH domain
LIDCNPIADNRGMAKKYTGEQEGNQALALLIVRAIKGSGLMGKQIAEMCGVKPQAVSSWKTTGRIDKQNLEKLARLTGKPLEYFSTLPPEQRPARRSTMLARENAARYEVDKAATATDAGKLLARILRLSPEQRRLVEQLVEQLAS